MLTGLMSLWTRPRLWSLPRAMAIPDDQAQEASYLHGRIEQQPLERLAAHILEQYNPIDESQLIRRLRAPLRS